MGTPTPIQSKYNRNFACIALDNPKHIENVGGVLRACHVFGAKMIILSGHRVKDKIRSHVDTTKAWKHIPTIISDDIFDVIPYDAVPIAVEILPDATPLPDFRHPQRAVYIFGPENGTLGKRITEQCKEVVYLPTHNACLNLAACANVVLYDRFIRMNNPQQLKPEQLKGHSSFLV